MASIKRVMAVVLILVPLAAAGCGSKTTTPPTTGNIEGYVFGHDASTIRSITDTPSRQSEPPSNTIPLNDASVILSPGGRRATTGTDGRGNGGYFRFLGLEPGTYTATVSHSGYNDGTFTVEARAGETILAGASNGQTVLEAVGPSPRRKWTFMVYMDADSDLEQYGILNMNQLETVGSNADINIVVQFDRIRRIGFDDQSNGDWTDTRRFYVIKDNDTQNILSPVVQNLGEIDMGDPASLQDFIRWATTNYPADHYVLVPWNHGAGWRSRAISMPSRGILFDESGNPIQFSGETFMTMGEFNTGLTVPGIHFDLIAIDCSLMGMLEVCYEIKDRTTYINASEESPPGAGYPYDKILARLAANPNMTPEDLGRVFVDEHIANYQGSAVTQSLIDTSRLPAVGPKLNDFATALTAALPANRLAITQARSASQSYAYTVYRDLYDFASKAQATVNDNAVSTTASALMQALLGENGGPILYEKHNLSTVGGSHGLSIYLPDTQPWTGYEILRFTRDYPKWDLFIRALANG